MDYFIEIQNWGFNFLVITSIITIVFTIFQAYGFIRQGRKIWRRKSVKSISGPFFFLFFFYFIAFTFYGYEQKSLAMTLNGLLFLPCAPIVIGIIKFRRPDILDIISFLLSLAIVPIMILIEAKDVFLLILLLISLISLLSQALTMLKNKSRGAVDIKFIGIFLSTSIFWLVYSILINNWPLEIFNSLAIIVYAFIIYLYRKYKA